VSVSGGAGKDGQSDNDSDGDWNHDWDNDGAIRLASWGGNLDTRRGALHFIIPLHNHTT